MEYIKAGLKADDHEYQETDGNTCRQACDIDDGIIPVPGQTPENIDKVVSDHMSSDWIGG